MVVRTTIGRVCGLRRGRAAAPMVEFELTYRHRECPGTTVVPAELALHRSQTLERSPDRWNTASRRSICPAPRERADRRLPPRPFALRSTRPGSHRSANGAPARLHRIAL